MLKRDDHRERQFLYSQWVSRESTVITTAVNSGRISISIISLNFIAMAILAPKAFSYWFSALVNFERFRVIGGNNNSYSKKPATTAPTFGIQSLHDDALPWRLQKGSKTPLRFIFFHFWYFITFSKHIISSTNESAN